MKSYYTESTDRGFHITISNAREEHTSYEDSSDVFAISLVVGFAIFLICII